MSREAALHEIQIGEWFVAASALEVGLIALSSSSMLTTKSKLPQPAPPLGALALGDLLETLAMCPTRRLRTRVDSQSCSGSCWPCSFQPSSVRHVDLNRQAFSPRCGLDLWSFHKPTTNSRHFLRARSSNAVTCSAQEVPADLSR